MKGILVIGLCFQLTSALAQIAVDSLDLWNFDLEILHNTESTKPIGQISFWRTKPIDDGISVKLYGKLWTPDISYEIFPLSDSAYCRRQSLGTKVISSCVDANVGGDLVRVGNYLFLNRSVCVNCIRYNTNTDYCRPVVKQLLDKVDQDNVNTLDAIVRQFGIKESDRHKTNR